MADLDVDRLRIQTLVDVEKHVDTDRLRAQTMLLGPGNTLHTVRIRVQTLITISLDNDIHVDAPLFTAITGPLHDSVDGALGPSSNGDGSPG